MGYLAIRDTGSLGLSTTSNYFTPIYDDADSNAINPEWSVYPYNKGVVPLKAFKLSYTLGKKIDATPSVAGNTSRLGFGSVNPVEINLSLFSEKTFESGSDEPQIDEVDIVSLLSIWSRRKTILMLFWIPNSDNPESNELYKGQVREFYYSSLKSLYDVLWNRTLFTSSSRGYNATTKYGAVWYKLSQFYSDSSDYDACAIPVVINSVQPNVSASGNRKDFFNVNVTGYALEDEDLSIND